MESIIESLEKLGLTRYEAKAYIGMTNLISGKAEEIAKASEIPRSKIYNTLKELNKKGFITIIHTRPLEYQAVPPSEIFKRKKEELIKELELSQEKLDEIYNDQLSEIQAPVWLIKTSENIINKEIEIVKRARKSINMRIGFLLEGEGEALIKAFKELPRGIPIKILATPECYINGEKLEIIKKLIGVTILAISVPFGLLFMCYTKIFSALISLFINTYYTGKLIQVGFFRQLGDLSKTLVTSLCMFAIVFGINHYIDSYLVQLIADIIVGAVFYIGVAFVFKFEEVDYLKSILKKDETTR